MKELLIEIRIQEIHPEFGDKQIYVKVFNDLSKAQSYYDTKSKEAIKSGGYCSVTANIIINVTNNDTHTRTVTGRS